MNLLLDPLTLEQIEAILAAHPRRPLIPPMGHGEWLWTAQNPIVQKLIVPLRETALKECGVPLPVLTDDLYADFRKTGIRLNFERVYFERRRRLARASMTLLLAAPNDPVRAKLEASVLEKFTGIFEEVSWALTAHVNWHNDDVSGKEPRMIDLFCAETSNLMAEMIDLFGAIIPAALQARVRERLKRDVFENYLENFEKFGHWTKATHNWNAVCHQGVIGSALSQCEDNALLARMLMAARGSLPLFRSGFTSDGGCTEGAGYWSYGFGWFVVMNEQLETRTDGELSVFEGDEQIKRIARFGPGMSLFKSKRVNFSDNGPDGDVGPALATYLGERLKDPVFTVQAGNSYAALIRNGIDQNTERCDVLFLARMLLNCPDHVPAEKQATEDYFLPDLAVLVTHGVDARGHIWDFAAKAGHNGEHHNHNDCGSYILNIDGVRFVAEIGAPEYDKGFFSPKRYEYLAARTLGHSLPLINGCEQSPGDKFTSRVVKQKSGGDVVEFTVEAAASYPAEAGCRAFTRELVFHKSAGKVTVTDSFELDKTNKLEDALVSMAPIQLEEGRATIEVGKLKLIIAALPGTKFVRVEQQSYNNRNGELSEIQRLIYAPVELKSAVKIGLELTLA